MRKDTSEQEKEKDLHVVLFSGDEDDRNPNSLLPPPYEDVHQQWTQQCEEESRIAARRLHTNFYKIHVTYEAHKNTFYNTKTVTGAISQTGINHEERECTVDTGALVLVMRKSDLIHEEKQPFGNQMRQKKPTVHFRDLDTFFYSPMQVQHRETDRRQLQVTKSKIFQTGFSHLRKVW